MTDEARTAVADAWYSLRTRIDRRTGSPDEEYLLFRLGGADYISLLALFVAWGAILLLLRGEPNWAIVTMLGAFVFDKLDGYYARSFGEPTDFGRHVDGYIDIFTYLVPAVALFHYELSPHLLASLVVGFAVLAFGGLRLVRFTSEGLQTEGETSYYRGITVVHTNMVVLANYFLFAFVDPWNGWLAAATVLVVAPIMISNYRSYKTVESHSLAAVAGLVVVGLCLALEFGV